MNVKEINTAIISGTWTDLELRSIVDAIKYARSRVAATVKASLHAGDTVEFTSSKLGGVVRGEVIKVAIKNVTVKTARGNWQVPASMLRLVETV
jgi:hypothetical protein